MRRIIPRGLFYKRPHRRGGLKRISPVIKTEPMTPSQSLAADQKDAIRHLVESNARDRRSIREYEESTKRVCGYDQAQHRHTEKRLAANEEELAKRVKANGECVE